MASQDTRIVVIAVDASKQADEAFDWYLANLARDHDDVRVVHCAEFHIDFSVGMNYDEKAMQQLTEKMKAQQDRIDQLKSKFIDRLRGKKNLQQIKGEAFILSGKKPGEAIIEAAEQHKANLIICGTRGLGNIKRAFMGSVSDYIVRHATCPVVVVRND